MALRGMLAGNTQRERPMSVLRTCTDCGAQLGESDQTCPRCGSGNRSLMVSDEIRPRLSEDVRLRGGPGPRVSRDNCAFETVVRDGTSRASGEPTTEQRRISFTDDRYQKVVAEKETGRVIFQRDERLSEHLHRGTGSANREDKASLGDLTLGQFVEDLARAIRTADSAAPKHATYMPGIGPHTEKLTLALAMRVLSSELPTIYADYSEEVPYPSARRSKCDLCLGTAPAWQWAIEAKMLRFMGDNGKPNDNILMHILSPYPAHRSAVTDGPKLLGSGLAGRKAIVIFGYDYPDWPMDPAIEAFELLAGERVTLGPRQVASYFGLVHPIHVAGRVFGWELLQDGPASG